MSPLGIEKRPVYLSVDKGGHIVRKDSGGNASTYDNIESHLVGLRRQRIESELYGKSDKLVLDFEDADGTRYALSMGLHTGHARSIVLSLAGVERFGVVKITTWKSDDGYIRAAVKNDGQPLRWSHPLPPADVDPDGGRDTSARDQFIDRLIDGIAVRLGCGTTRPAPDTLAEAVREKRQQATAGDTASSDDVEF